MRARIRLQPLTENASFLRLIISLSNTTRHASVRARLAVVAARALVRTSTIGSRQAFALVGAVGVYAFSADGAPVFVQCTLVDVETVFTVVARATRTCSGAAVADGMGGIVVSRY